MNSRSGVRNLLPLVPVVNTENRCDFIEMIGTAILNIMTPCVTALSIKELNICTLTIKTHRITILIITKLSKRIMILRTTRLSASQQKSL